MIWDILGISETKDKNAITEAYRNKLLVTNPEDKPEEFMELRRAYEEAMAFADTEDNGPKTDIDYWFDDLCDVYSDFSKRKNINCWKELLNQDICHVIGNKEIIEDKLLTFMMSNYHLSQETIIYLDEYFGFQQRYNELIEKYPREFIDYIIIGGIDTPDRLPFEMFEPGLNGDDIDEYHNLYIKAVNCKKEEEAEIFERLDSLSEYHPFGEAIQLLSAIREGRVELIPNLKGVVERCGYAIEAAQMLADAYYENKDYENCVEVCDKALAKEHGNRMMNTKALALAGLERYEDAIDTLHLLMDKANGNHSIINHISELRSTFNEKLIEQYTQKLNENPDDQDINHKMAWALLQNMRADDAVPYVEKMEFEKPDPFGYYNLLTSLHLERENYKEAIEPLDKLIDVIKNMEDDGTDLTARRIKRLGEMYTRKGYLHFQLKEMEEGMEAFNRAIEESPEDGTILTNFISILHSFKKYEESLPYIQQLLKLAPTSFHSYLLDAKANFYLHRDRDAFDSVNRALEYDNSQLELYILKLRLFLRNGVDDGSRDLIKFLEDNGVNDPSLDFCKAIYEQYVTKDKEKAKQLYEEVIEAHRNGAFVVDADQVFYSYLVLIGTMLDVSVKVNRDKMIEVARDGLAINEDNDDLKDYLAWLLVRDDKDDEALEIYLKLAEKPNHNPDVEYQIGSIYYNKDFEQYAEDALHYLLKAYNSGNKDGALFKLIYLYTYIDELDEAEKYCLELRELAIKENYVDIDSYARMAFIYEARREFEKAYEQAKIALDHAFERKINPYYYLNHVVSLLRMLGRGDEAAEMLLANKDSYSNKIGFYYRSLATTYKQFGKFAKAIEACKEWQTVENQLEEASHHLVDVYLLMDDYANAKKTFKKTGKYMSEEMYDKTQVLFDEYDLNHAKQLKFNEKIIANGKGDISFNYIQLAVIYAEKGDRDNKLKAAVKALNYFEEHRDKYSQHKALDHIFLAKIYICLERFEEARKELELARHSTCDFCNYGRCKDADQYEVFLNIELGKYEEAEKLNQEYGKMWPDESSFKSYSVIIKNRTKKKWF